MTDGRGPSVRGEEGRRWGELVRGVRCSKSHVPAVLVQHASSQYSHSVVTQHSPCMRSNARHMTVYQYNVYFHICSLTFRSYAIRCGKD